jgi:hypothetical protein
MAKYLEHDGQGGFKEVIPLDSSSGASDAEKIIQLGADGRINENMLPTGIGADTAIVEASEDLASGDMVNIWDDAGTIKVRKADATTTGKETNGFVLSAVTSGNNAEIYFGGTNNQLTGMTPGKYQFLDTTAGGITETAPTTTGNVVQVVGKSFSATEITFEAMMPIELA